VKMEMAYKAVSISEETEVVSIVRKAVQSVGLDPQVRIICGWDRRLHLQQARNPESPLS